MHVLLAHDSSSHAQSAADFLRRFTFRKPIELDIVAAVAPPLMVDSSIMGMPQDLGVFINEERDLMSQQLSELAQQFDCLEHPPHAVHTHVPIGPPTTEILNCAENTHADLIVLGAIGHSAVERALLGSVSDYVATHADVSTLVVRPPTEASVSVQLNKILLALSGKPEDERMLDFLKGIKLRPNVEVHLVRIMELHTLYRQDIRQRASAFWKEQVREAQSQILDFETKLQAFGLNTETHLVEAGHVGEALIQYSDQHGCDLIVTGDSDSGLLTRVFLGSTSRYVLRHAHCSMLIVRDREDRLAAKQQAAQQTHAAPVS